MLLSILSGIGRRRRRRSRRESPKSRDPRPEIRAGPAGSRERNNLMNFARLRSKSFLVPTAVTFLFLAVVLALLGTGERKYAPLARTLIQWDGRHYLAIAETGYEKFPCPEDPSLVCGNVGWFPLFPLAARVVSVALGPLGLGMAWSMLITGWLCLWAAMLLLYRLFARRFDHTVAAGSLAALALFPTSFYYLTAFPYALYLLLAAAVFLLVEKERYFAAAAPAGLLAITYPTGVAIILPLLWVLVSRWRGLTPRDRAGLRTASAAVVLALILYALYYRLAFGDFFLYVHFQSKPYYAHGATVPLLPILDAVVHLPGAHPVRVMLIFVAAALALFSTRRIPAAWQVFLWGVLLFTPAAGTTACYYRHVVVAFPLFAMVGLSLRSRRRPLAVLYAAAALALMLGVFLDAYKRGVLM